MEFQDAGVEIVLKLIARNTGIDLEISKEIEGLISLNLRNFSWRDALYTLSRCRPFHLELSNPATRVRSFRRRAT